MQCNTMFCQLLYLRLKSTGFFVRIRLSEKILIDLLNASFPLSMESSRRGVYAPQSLYTFPATHVGEVSTLKVNFRNNSCNTHEVSVQGKL